jgi:hypothetical protein
VTSGGPLTRRSGSSSRTFVRVAFFFAPVVGAIAACEKFGAKEEPVDASAQVDTSTPVDASTQLDGSGPDARAQDSTFCASQSTADLLFCDSFDVKGISEWNGIDADPTTDYGVEDASFVSPPASARCRIWPGTPNSADARLVRHMAGSYSWFEVSGMARVTGGTQPLQFAVVEIGGVVLFLFTNGETRWRATAPQEVLFTMNPIVRQAFFFFSIRVDLRTKDVAVTLGTDKEGGKLPYLPAAPASLSVRIGPAESETDAGWTNLYDNIVVRGGT